MINTNNEKGVYNVLMDKYAFRSLYANNDVQFDLTRYELVQRDEIETSTFHYTQLN